MTDRLISDLDNFSVSSLKSSDVEDCKKFLSNNPNTLNILNQNIRSIFKNIDNLGVTLQRLNINCDIIVLTECWLQNRDDHIPSLPEYHMYHSRNYANQNDGVVVYAKNSLDITVESPAFRYGSCLLLKVSKDTAILAIYRPSAYKQQEEIEGFLSSLNSTLDDLTSFKNIILTGDINLDIKPDCNDTQSLNYQDICSTHGLLHAHTLPTHESGSCLDHMALKTNLPSITIVINSSVTDHRAVLLNLSLKLPKQKRPNAITKVNMQNLENDLCNIDFSPVYSSADANISLPFFVNTIQQAISRNTKTIKLTRRNISLKPWISQGLIRCMKHRDNLHLKAKASPKNTVLQITYKRYRNFCNNLLKKLKVAYEKNQLESAGKDCKKVWKYVKQFTYMTKQRESSENLLHVHDSPLQSTDRINIFFVNVGKTLAEKIPTHTHKAITNIVRRANSFVLIGTEISEVKRIIQNLKQNCAVGWDNISNKILKKFNHILAPHLTHIFQICLSDGVFPTCLKQALVTPVYKSGNKDLVSNYRPISVLPSISKILEKLINNRLVKYLQENSILSDQQFGFRPNLSTSDAVHSLTDFITKELDKNNYTIGIFLDLAKAFDTVSVPILLLKLESLGIRGTQLKLFEDYLSNRCQKVKVGKVIGSVQKKFTFWNTAR